MKYSSQFSTAVLVSAFALGWSTPITAMTAQDLANMKSHGGSIASGDTFTSIPQEVIDLVATLLPEYSNDGAAFVSESYSPNLIISEDATVEIIFVWEGAGYRNSLGWFSFVENTDGSVTVTDANLIWANVSFPTGGDMVTGDTNTLRLADGTPRTFVAGEKVGFFVVANGYNQSSEIQNWDPYNPTLPKTTPASNAGVSGGKGCFTSIETINPEYSAGNSALARHLAMIRVAGIPGFLDGSDFIISGFEDLNRTQGSDDDFNDAVFIIDASPIEAISETDVFVYSEGDPDGDGVFGVDDHYPNDSERAFILRTPTHGYNVVGFEDLYPKHGDADYNDVGLAYVFECVTDASGLVKDVQADFHLITRGAGLDHSFGIHFPQLDESRTGTVELERFYSDDSLTHSTESRTIADMINLGQRRVSDIFPSTQAALPSSGSFYTNTGSQEIEREAASARLLITFDQAVSTLELGTVPYDLWFGVPSSQGLIDIHFTGFDGFSDRPSELPVESGNGSFLDDNGYPWLLEIPTNWAVPLEKIHIETAYPEFQSWRASSGSSNTDWYLNPGAAQYRTGDLSDYIPTRTWTVKLPQP